MIGVIAGVGPFAGLDLLNKIAAQTIAHTDQEHLTVVSISQPSAIPDRTAFLLNGSDINPAGPILAQLQQLEQLGATVAGIPCNTAHAPQIFDLITQGLAASGSRLQLLHMIAEVGVALRHQYPAMTTVGLLSTTGTARARVYPHTLEPLGYRVLAPDPQLQERIIHPAIYDADYGIKARGYATTRARDGILQGIAHLHSQGAQAIILGCTELPLAFPESEIDGLPLVDSTLILARALIAAVDPQKLRSWES
jgi:aspartate racemase